MESGEVMQLDCVSSTVGRKVVVVVIISIVSNVGCLIVLVTDARHVEVSGSEGCVGCGLIVVIFLVGF